MMLRSGADDLLETNVTRDVDKADIAAKAASGENRGLRPIR